MSHERSNPNLRKDSVPGVAMTELPRVLAPTSLLLDKPADREDREARRAADRKDRNIWSRITPE